MPQTKSLFGIVDTATGKINVKAEIDRQKYFGEGISVFNNKIYFLTWQNQLGFIYDAKTFNAAGQFSFKNKEGWGLTNDGTNFIMSDGTSDLTYFEPVNFNYVKTLVVNTIDHDLPDQLNELEYIAGFIFANVWRTNKIVKIDPVSGNIVGILDLTSLASKAKEKYVNSQEMNGIAYDAASKRIFVTGKMWPEIYVITVDEVKM
jgi:glutamine cyclotransferase